MRARNRVETGLWRNSRLCLADCACSHSFHSLFGQQTGGSVTVQNVEIINQNLWWNYHTSNKRVVKAMNIDKQKLISEITSPLKINGYKKRSTTWVKSSDPQNGIFTIINIQGSQYDKRDYYVNLGVYIQALGYKNAPSCISDCHMQERIMSEISSSEFFLQIAEKWESYYGSYEHIYEKVLTSKMPMLTDKRLSSYFLITGKKQ